MECLKAEGVDVVFGYPGGANMPTYDAFVDAGIRHILEADLWEISVVTFPMLPGARIGEVKLAKTRKGRQAEDARLIRAIADAARRIC